MGDHKHPSPRPRLACFCWELGEGCGLGEDKPHCFQQKLETRLWGHWARTSHRPYHGRRGPHSRPWLVLALLRPEDQKRLVFRSLMSTYNTRLAEAAQHVSTHHKLLYSRTRLLPKQAMQWLWLEVQHRA